MAFILIEAPKMTLNASGILYFYFTYIDSILNKPFVYVI